MGDSTLKLVIDLVPQTCWYKSLYKQMRRSQWDLLRKEVCTAQHNRCAVCGAGGKLYCHETWEYDEDRCIQRLAGFRALCSLCHHITHFGRARMLAVQGQLDLETLIEHFMKVNGVRRTDFESHEKEAFRKWRERSKHKWRTDLGEWASLVTEGSTKQEGKDWSNLH